MAEVGGKVMYVLNTVNSVKHVAITFTAGTTGDVITMSGAATMNTILFRSVHAQGTGDALASVTAASNQLTLGVTTGVASGYANVVGY